MKKIKIVTLVLIGAVIYACGAKKTTSSTTVSAPPSEPKVEVALTPELAEGKSIYENSCGRCHKLFAPTSRTKEKWGPIVDRMAPKAKLTDAQKALVYNYVIAGL